MGKTRGSQSFIKNFFVLGFGSFIYLVIGLIGTPVITRLVDPAEYGYMSMFTVYSNIGLMFCGLGLDQTLVRYFYHRDDLDYKRMILFECMSAPMILCAVLGLLILPAALFTNTMGWTSQPISELVLLEINVFVLVVHRYAILLLRLRYHTKQYSTINIIQKATYLIIAVALVVWLRDYYFYILAVSTILSTLIATVCALLLEKEVWDFRALSRENWIPQKELLSYSIPIMFSSGIAMILQRVLGKGGIGLYTAVMNVPLFVIGYRRLGRGFFFGSLLGMACNSLLIDLLAGLPAPQVETMLGVIFGGVLTGAGLGLVFLPGATTGGTDILARLLKRHLREVKMGYVTLAIDTVVLILTGLVFRDISKTLYSAVTLFICSRVLDAVLYGLDYSSVALIISDRYEDVYRAIDKQLDRGVTFLEGRGGYTGAPKTVLMTAVKSRQISELKQLVQCIDPNAFMIVQPAHQVLGEGFKRYSDDI